LDEFTCYLLPLIKTLNVNHLVVGVAYFRFSLRADILFSEDVSYPVFNAMKMTIRD